jgi:hypothetical protein
MELFAFFSLSGGRFILNTNSIRDMKTETIKEPAMLLSTELWALKNQIEKRISVTKSITAKSEYG